MNPDDRPQELTPDRVEWVPSSPDAIEVRVFGAWHGPTVPPAVVLVVGPARVDALAVPPGLDVPPAWSAAFLVPVEARPAVEGGGALLDVGGFMVPLPAAEPGRMAPVLSTVVDPAVMAERRVRRAEIAEQSAAERAASAEHSADTLRAQLANLEERLARAADERDSLAARVADAERRLRLAEQREEAERRRRGELEEELAAERREAENDLQDLNDRLSSAEEVAEALERELGHARRREQLERAARERTDDELRAALDRVSALEDARADVDELQRRLTMTQSAVAQGAAAVMERDELRRRLAETEAASAQVEELRARLAAAEGEGAVADAAEVEELRRRLAESEQALAAEREAHTAAEQALAAEREAHAAAEQARRRAARRTQAERAAREAAERLLAEGGAGDPDARVVTLEAELAKRAETHERVQAAIEVIRTELAGVRRQVDERGSGAPAATRAELDALAERSRVLEAQLRERDAELVSTRAALEDARASAAAAERITEELRARLADEQRLRSGSEESLRTDFATRIGELTAEVATMRRRLHETTADLESRLAAEHARAEAAEAALADAAARAAAVREAAVVAPSPSAEPPRAEDASVLPGADASGPPAAEGAASPSGDDALDALLTGLRAQVDSAREQMEAWDREEEPEPRPAIAAPDEITRARLQAIEADIRAAVPKDEGPVPARDVIASLQQAAERLRAAAEEELSRIEDDDFDAPVAADGADAHAEAAVEAGAAATTSPRDPASDDVAETAAELDTAPEAHVVDAPAAEEPAGSAPAVDAAPAVDVAAPAVDVAPPAVDVAAPAVDVAPRAVDFGARESPWLRTAIERLSTSDPDTAAELLVALLPAQAMLGTELTYLLTAPNLGPVKVSLQPGRAEIERAPETPVVDARVSGSLAALAPLGAGGAPWRLKGVQLDGAKRRLRKLARRRRRPLGLDEFALVTPAPSPGVILAALAAAVEPSWTAGHRFGVSYIVAGQGRWTVLADDGKPLRIAEDGGEHGHAAIVQLSSEAVLPVLQGAGVPAGLRATVAGDRRAADVLHTWFDRARGVASR